MRIMGKKKGGKYIYTYIKQKKRINKKERKRSYILMGNKVDGVVSIALLALFISLTG